MENMVIEFMTKYGWQLTIAAISGIFILGILKYFDLFRKIESSKRKYIYSAISALFSIIASVGYLIIVNKFTWSFFLVLIPSIWAFTLTSYALYENLGIRTMFRKLGNLIINIIAKKQIENKRNEIKEKEVEEI